MSFLSKLLHKAANKADKHEWQDDPVTEGQTRYLYNLLEERTKKEINSLFPGALLAWTKGEMVGAVVRSIKTKGSASELITQLSDKD